MTLDWNKILFFAKSAGIQLDELRDMSWPEYYWRVDMFQIQNEWRWQQTREIIAVMAAGKKTGRDIMPLRIDSILRHEITADDRERMERELIEECIREGRTAHIPGQLKLKYGIQA